MASASVLEQGAPAEPHRSPARPLGAVLAAVGIPMFMVALDNLVVTFALPVIKTELHASLADLQWFVNAYVLSFAALLLTASSLGDRVGRLRLFVGGIGLFTLASAACALATDPLMLTAARAVQGVGAAAVMPLSLTLLAAAVPASKRSVAIGIWSAISGLGVAVGPLVGGAVVEGLAWQWIFWVNIPVGLVAIPLAARVLSDSRGASSTVDPLGLVLSSGGVLALVWGIVHGADDGWGSFGVVASLAGGVVLLAAFVWWERRAAAPMLPLRLFRSRGFVVANVVAFTFSAGVFGSVFLLAQFFQVVQGINPLDSAVRTMPWTMAPMVVAPLAGLLVDRVGARTLIIIGQVLLAGALLWTALVNSVDVGYGSIVIPFALAGIGMGLTFAPMTTAVLASVAPESHGVASGVNNTVREIAIAMGIATLASVFSSSGSYDSPASYVAGLMPAVMVGAAIVAVGAVLTLWLPSGVRSPDRVAR